MALEPGDRITTGEGGAARIGFPDDPTRVEVRAQAQLHFVRGGKSKRFEVLKGEIDAAVPPQAGEPLLLTTLHAELRVREAEFRLLDAAEFTRLEVRKGSAEFTRRIDGRRIDIAALQFAVAGKDLAFAPQTLGPGAPGAAGPAAIAVVRRVQGDAFVFNQSPAERLPLKAGQPVLEDQGLVTEGARSLIVLDYSDTTRLEIVGDTVVRRLTDEKDKTRKHVTLEGGSLSADVTKQPAERPMILSTAHADARVLGTRFTLAVEAGQTRLQVEEGAVQFTQSRERESIVVRSGYVAVAAPGRPFEAVRVPGAPTYLEIDLAAGVADGDGDWSARDRAVRQAKVSRRPEGPGLSPVASFLYKVEAKESDKGSVLLEATAEVNQVTPDASQGLGAWGFGLAAHFRNQNVILHSVQGEEGGSIFGFKDVSATPFEHGREGTYRLKLRVERRDNKPALLQGKIWQGDREPDGWMTEKELALDGPLTHVGFRTMRCACTFTSFRVKVLKEEPR
jgi:ferric-dicitrate binding protein FerR (iron transport regulator)